MSSIFIPCASVRRFAAISGYIPDGAEVYFTADERDLPELITRFTEICSVAGSASVVSMSLEDLAPSVVEAAEKLGGIEKMIFAPDLASESTIFLDLPEHEFLEHMEAVEGFFSLCKCAVPYMMGQECAEITALLPEEAQNAASVALSAALKAISERLLEELAPYGITVKTA